MQTFLPYVDFRQSARVLDRQRLGKQRVENLQIMKALVTGTGWVNHPATLMWRRYEWALLQYQKAICDEWTSRGYSDTCYEKTKELYNRYKYKLEDPAWPYWVGGDIHISHQSNLLRKDPDHYSTYFRKVPDDLEYVWPVPYDESVIFDPTPWWSWSR